MGEIFPSCSSSLLVIVTINLLRLLAALSTKSQALFIQFRGTYEQDKKYTCVHREVNDQLMFDYVAR